ncbi:hypothetical protein MAFF211479_39630 (plasmid) [Ralstonia solanacearum]|nr:hypothetical protein MAFF211479_39630 [Ralstonia solanacearum]BCN06828.1 hypothetical protein RPSB_39650 [Ralstonia solanacearum]
MALLSLHYSYFASQCLQMSKSGADVVGSEHRTGAGAPREVAIEEFINVAVEILKINSTSLRPEGKVRKAAQIQANPVRRIALLEHPVPIGLSKRCQRTVTQA